MTSCLWTEMVVKVWYSMRGYRGQLLEERCSVPCLDLHTRLNTRHAYEQSRREVKPSTKCRHHLHLESN